MGSTAYDLKMAGKSKRRFNRNATPSEVADWGGCDPRLLVRAVAIVSASGGALRLGYSRDGGAYAIGVYGDGDPYTEYVRPSEDIDKALIELIMAFGGDESDIPAKTASTAPRKP